ncbi:hypothetical protein [Thermococcus sp. AM4]|uniref:hypothetical protein n=1 Tax=Thermococcus sp. (strain AM4) TaxID=246969 RepID=UPI000187042B|nr:hypothetical protein [Thermococcus sp. AM4]EEB74719.1 hypothetical protein TAM4_664 [Thermococcus sp. AM4]
MKRLLLLLPLLFLPGVLAYPSWLRPGTYLVYHAEDPAGGTLLLYSCNGTEFLIVGISGITVNFSVLNVSKKGVEVGITVLLRPSRNSTTRSPGLHITFLTGKAHCNFWGSGETLIGQVPLEKDGKNVSTNMTTVIVDHALTLRGTYTVTPDGKVYSHSGTYLGHTVLWGLRELKPGDVFAILNGSAVTVVRNDNTDYDVITYWKTFQRPNGDLITNWSHITLPFYKTSFADIYYYNPALDITEVIMGSSPDLRAIGIVSISPNDAEAERYAHLHRNELARGTLKTIRPQGLSLYDANINIGSLYIPGKPPRTPLVYIFLASMILPLVAYTRR